MTKKGKTDNVDATYFLSQCIVAANTENRRGNFRAAADWCQQALRLAPDFPEAWYNLGIACREQGKRREAIAAFKKVSALTLASADAQNSIGLELIQLNALVEAQSCLDQAIKLAPDFPFPHSNMGLLKQQQKLFDEAERHFRQAIACQPDLPPAHANLAGVLNARKKYEEAEAASRKAIELASDLAAAWSNLGSALYGQGKHADAEAACRKAIELDPTLTEAWSNLGAALSNLRKHDAAEVAHRRALEFDPNAIEAWKNLGTALAESRQYKAAANAYAKCLELDPGAKLALGQMVHSKMQVCDWQDFAENLSALQAKIQAGELACEPFSLLSLSDDPDLLRKCAEASVAENHPVNDDLGGIKKRPRREKIRIGYYSADFREHPVSYLMVELFEIHDRSRFEVFGFSFGSHKDDEMRQRVSSAFDHFIDTDGKSDREIVELSRQLEIDIAIDLGGHTAGCRTGVFAMRAAPLQVSYIGYLGTMGAAYIDYLIADETIVPKALQAHYSEKIAYLPSYQANDSKRAIADRSFTREELGLPQSGFVFCCFNSTYKITPSTFALWLRILRQVEGSVLLLYAASDETIDNIRNAAQKLAVDQQRIVFAAKLPRPEYLARYRAADLFLDTFPYNAGTTASDALWAGLPVLTQMGQSFASRVAASLLNTLDLRELVAENEDAYEATAVRLATHAEELRAIKQKLEANRLSCPLYDARLFAQQIEAAYRAMYERYHNDLAPDHLYVATAG